MGDKRKGTLTSATLPSNVIERYTHDCYGNLTSTSVNGQTTWQLDTSDGNVTEETAIGNFKLTTRNDDNGLLKSKNLSLGTQSLLTQTYTFSPSTLDLPERYIGPLKDKFTYDSSDRLISAKWDMTDEVEYSANGNIASRTGLGAYTYSSGHPHAVETIEYKNTTIPTFLLQEIKYDGHSKPTHISYGIHTMDIVYGSDGDRWKSTQKKTLGPTTEVLYGDGYERVSKADTTRHYYYLSGNVLMIRQEGAADKYYYMLTDHQGSIIRAYAEDGTEVFAVSYDAWGKQTVEKNAIGLRRGYTGHEMLADFKLINMNGRLYDPLIGRFLSPDNYVQLPDNSQNFNRYSYCLNNPLKYVDPSGDMAWFVPVVVGAAIGAYTGASIHSHTVAFWNWKSDSWKAGIVGSIIGGAMGYSVSSALGVYGLSSGITTLLSGAQVITQPAGITSSILYNGLVNMAINTVFGGNLDDAWKAGLVGMATGSWAITGGFGMVKGFGTNNAFGKLMGKLGYQMVGTISQSIGDNWAMGKGIFSRIVLGIGPLNLTLGKGQKPLQLRNNLIGLITNIIGISNLAFHGKVKFDWNNLTPIYYGGLIEKRMRKGYDGYGAYAIFLQKDQLIKDGETFKHELHHLWHSRAMYDAFFPTYLLQAIPSLMKGSGLIGKSNYYESIAYKHLWF